MAIPKGTGLEKLFDVVKVASTITHSKSSDSQGSSSSDKDNTRIINTNDDDTRECTVELWTRYVGLGVSYHWALVFRWENPIYVAIFEASEHEGMLTNFMNEGEPDPKYNWETDGVYKARKCSPEQVVEYASDLCLGDGIYNAINNNCQDYAKQLAKLFKVTLPKGAASIVRDPLNFEPKPKIRFKNKEEGYVAIARRKFGEGVGYMLKDN